ncbi:MAG: hypothetical protein AAF596_07670, partial [Planctomycetota bacterium]
MTPAEPLDQTRGDDMAADFSITQSWVQSWVQSRVRVTLAIVVTTSLAAGTAWAQSGGYRAPAGSGSGNAGSGHGPAAPTATAPQTTAPVALRGFCPVCLVELKQWVRGNPEFASVVDGKAYYFPDAATKAKFDATPATYVPALGGDDVVTYARTGRRAPASLAYGVLHDGRPYFFASDANKRQFEASPAAFAMVDVALGGDCV